VKSSYLNLNEEPPDEQGDENHEIHYLIKYRIKEPDLNEGPPEEQGDESHHLQEEGQTHYLQKGEHGGVHAIDINVAASEGQQQEPHLIVDLAVDEDHQQDGDIKFDGLHEQEQCSQKK